MFGGGGALAERRQRTAEDAVFKRDGSDFVWTEGTLGWSSVDVQVTGESEGRVAIEGIEPGTRWEDVPVSWCCPDCGAGKEDFEMVEI